MSAQKVVVADVLIARHIHYLDGEEIGDRRHISKSSLFWGVCFMQILHVHNVYQDTA